MQGYFKHWIKLKPGKTNRTRFWQTVSTVTRSKYEMLLHKIKVLLFVYPVFLVPFYGWDFKRWLWNKFQLGGIFSNRSLCVCATCECIISFSRDLPGSGSRLWVFLDPALDFDWIQSQDKAFYIVPWFFFDLGSRVWLNSST